MTVVSAVVPFSLCSDACTPRDRQSPSAAAEPSQKIFLSFHFLCHRTLAPNLNYSQKKADDFVVNEMRLSNISDRVTRFDAGDGCEKEAARRLFRMLRGHEPSLSDLRSSVLLEDLSGSGVGSLILMEIEPVYGAK